LRNLSQPWTPTTQTPVYCDNATAVGIANNMVKYQRLRSMEMRYFGVGDKEAQEMFKLLWHPGLENLADYQSKNHAGSHHAAVRPYYLHMENSPRLPRALRLSTLKECVGTIEGGYIHNIPLPRVPRVQSASLITSTSCETTIASIDTCYSQVQGVCTWSYLAKLLAGLGRNILPFSPVWLM
jgi:hypothetical protein